MKDETTSAQMQLALSVCLKSRETVRKPGNVLTPFTRQINSTRRSWLCGTKIDRQQMSSLLGNASGSARAGAPMLWIMGALRDEDSHFVGPPADGWPVRIPGTGAVWK